MLNSERKLIRHLRDLIGQRVPATVLELGANDGWHTRLFLEEFSDPGFRIFAFEPDPRPIRRWTITDPRCRGPIPLAIANQDGTLTFHQSGGDDGNQSWLEDWDLSGSIHKPKGHLQMSPWVTFNRQIDVDCRRLDTWITEIQEPLPIIDLLWADVQGAEGDVILGGRDTLARTRFLYSEFYNTEIYEGQLPLHALLALLGDDWVLCNTYEDNFLARNKRL